MPSQAELLWPKQDRVAALIIPSIRLQLAQKRRPEWAGDAIAIVEETGPSAPLIELNYAATRAGLKVGMSQGAARNLVPDIRIAQVSKQDEDELSDELARSLQVMSPKVERGRFPGSFLLDPRGLEGLFGSMRAWGSALCGYLRGRKLRSRLVIGFDAYRALAIAHQKEGVVLIRNAQEEAELSGGLSLDQIPMRDRTRAALERLGVESLRQLLQLPVGELKTRFGRDIVEWVELFSQSRQIPIQAIPFESLYRIAIDLDTPIQNASRLQAQILEGATSLMGDLNRSGKSLSSLEINLYPEQHQSDPDLGEILIRIEPASPSTSVTLVEELLRLKLEKIHLPRKIEHISLEASGQASEETQLSAENLVRPRARDIEAAERALARVRAAFGEQSVVRAELREAHLPEGRFALLSEDACVLSNVQVREAKELRTSYVLEEESRPAHHTLLKLPISQNKEAPSKAAELHSEAPSATFVPSPLSRRLHAPQPVPGTEETGPVLGASAVALYGPHRISGGWWGAISEDGKLSERERDYFYAELSSGELVWVFFNKKKKRWFRQGECG